MAVVTEWRHQEKAHCKCAKLGAQGRNRTTDTGIFSPFKAPLASRFSLWGRPSSTSQDPSSQVRRSTVMHGHSETTTQTATPLTKKPSDCISHVWRPNVPPRFASIQRIYEHSRAHGRTGFPPPSS